MLYFPTYPLTPEQRAKLVLGIEVELRPCRITDEGFMMFGGAIVYTDKYEARRAMLHRMERA